MSVKVKPRARAKGLGRGISALMEDSSYDDSSPATPTSLTVSELKPGKYQPRRSFPEAELEELATSIRRNGLVQPIVARTLPDGSYEIIAGERRWRASQRAGLTEVPVLIRELDDKQALEFALIENIQRQDLNPLEEAEGYQRLVDDFGYVQDELAATVGKSRSHVTNIMRLLSLPESVKELVANRELSMGHARALVNTENPEALAQTVISRGLNVRQTENLAKTGGNSDAVKKPRAPRTQAQAAANDAHHPDRSEPLEKDDDTMALEASLSESLGTHVSINHYEDSPGEVILRFDSLTELDGLLRKLTGMG